MSSAVLAVKAASSVRTLVNAVLLIVVGMVFAITFADGKCLAALHVNCRQLFA
jgi:hypothetical protein